MPRSDPRTAEPTGPRAAGPESLIAHDCLCHAVEEIALMERERVVRLRVDVYADDTESGSPVAFTGTAGAAEPVNQQGPGAHDAGEAKIFRSGHVIPPSARR